MMQEIKSVITRSHANLIGDMVGAASLCVMLVVALHLPGLD